MGLDLDCANSAKNLVSGLSEVGFDAWGGCGTGSVLSPSCL